MICTLHYLVVLSRWTWGSQKGTSMTHDTLSPEINAFIQKVDQNSGFDICTLPVDSLFEIHTLNSIYTIVVLDPTRSVIALKGPHKNLETADVMTYMGATQFIGSSVIKLAWVGVGQCFQAKMLDGSLLVTTTIRTFVMLSDADKASSIRSEALARRPGILEPVTEAKIKAWQVDFDAKIAVDFAGEHLEAVQNWLAQFSIDGQCNAASFFAAARDIGKLPEALETISRHFRKHWVYKAPEIRGSLITPSDAAQWQAAYAEAGVPIS